MSNTPTIFMSNRTTIPSLRYSILLPSFLLLGCWQFQSLTKADDDFYEKKIRPLLVERCHECHSGSNRSGGLSLSSPSGWEKGGDSGPAIVPGQPDMSLLVDAIEYGELKMPPPDEGKQLATEEIQLLKRWIANGAQTPQSSGGVAEKMSAEMAKKWWSFQPLNAADPNDDSSTVDRMIGQHWPRHQLKPAPLADKRIWIRRATYDLTGLPPRPVDVTNFLEDENPTAFEKVVDRLLGSTEYGEHWGRHWLDVVRYADTAGENSDRPLPHAWRYRNWVIDAINSDLPFDEMARLQIAGDLLPAGSPPIDHADRVVATGYLAIARRYGHDIDKDIHLMHEDVIDNLGKTFLGLTIGCARCHDHKYDPVTAEDYYALYGIFESTRFSFPGCEPKGQPRDLVPLIPDQKVEQLNAAYKKSLEKYQQQQGNHPDEIERMRKLAATCFHVLEEGKVEEGGLVQVGFSVKGSLQRKVQQGEVIQLAILRNQNHGADTTLVQLKFTNMKRPNQKWTTAELIPLLHQGGPVIEIRQSQWALLDVTTGPKYLWEKRPDVDGVKGLHAWASGPTPSITVNSNGHPVQVWTELPANSLFLHPGPKEDVALAWVCPEDGVYLIEGTVSDGHPAPGLDGVSYRLEHFSSSDYGSALVKAGKKIGQSKLTQPTPPSIPVAYAVTDGVIADTRVHQRGDPEMLGNKVPRGWLSIFKGGTVASAKESGRRELASWITEHPLFARVLANRIWQGHFGKGIVTTANDFGFRGTPPSHPELLEFLAAQLVAHGYRIKPLHRLIMLSETYRRGSQTSGIDPSSLRWLASFPPRRLTAEEIRDSLLVAGAMLDRTPGQAHPFPPEKSWTFSQHAPFNAIYPTRQRSVYMMVQRQRRHPFLALFDGADPNSSTPVRQTTTVPTQALFFLNDEFFHQVAAANATQVLKMPGFEQRLNTIFERLFQRVPSSAEKNIARQFFAGSHGDELEQWSAFSRILLSTNEFLYVD